MPYVELPSPLPWRITITAAVTSFSVPLVTLKCSCLNVIWEADVPAGAIKDLHPEGPRIGELVLVTLEPIRGAQ